MKGVMDMDFDKKKEIMIEIAKIIKELPENLHEKAFDYLIGAVNQTAIPDENTIHEEDINDKVTAKNKKNTIPKKSNTQNQPQQIKDLNLRPSDKKTLKEIFDEKQPKGNIENSAVMVYYLEHVLDMQEITPNHVFTCYRELNLKIPAVLNQNLRDCASSRYGYIDFANNQLKTSVRGINFVEQDLPKTKKK
jgi:hypothetical protein